MNQLRWFQFIASHSESIVNSGTVGWTTTDDE